MSDTTRSIAAAAFQVYPALLVAAVAALFAPTGTAAATAMILALTTAGWVRSQRRRLASDAARSRFADA